MEQCSGACSTNVRAFQIKMEFGSVGFSGEEKTRVQEYLEKKLSEQGENQQQRQPTYDAGTEK